MQSERQSSKELKGGVNSKNSRTASEVSFLLAVTVLTIMGTLCILGALAQAENGLWRTAAGVVMCVIWWGYIIRSLYHRK
jgi:hypothetical protein